MSHGNRVLRWACRIVRSVQEPPTSSRWPPDTRSQQRGRSRSMSPMHRPAESTHPQPSSRGGETRGSRNTTPVFEEHRSRTIPVFGRRQPALTEQDRINAFAPSLVEYDETAAMNQTAHGSPSHDTAGRGTVPLRATVGLICLLYYARRPSRQVFFLKACPSSKQNYRSSQKASAEPSTHSLASFPPGTYPWLCYRGLFSYLLFSPNMNY